MYDPDIIAYLFPAEGAGRDGAIEAINNPANKSRYLPTRRRTDSADPETSDDDLNFMLLIVESTEKAQQRALAAWNR